MNYVFTISKVDDIKKKSHIILKSIRSLLWSECDTYNIYHYKINRYVIYCFFIRIYNVRYYFLRYCLVHDKRITLKEWYTRFKINIILFYYDIGILKLCIWPLKLRHKSSLYVSLTVFLILWCLILKSVVLWFSGAKCLLFFYARRYNREKCKGKQEKILRPAYHQFRVWQKV